MFFDEIVSVREAAERDVAAYGRARAILGRLTRHLLRGDPDAHFGFKMTRFSDGETMLTLRGSDLGLDGEDAALWLRFGKMRGYAPSGHIARFKRSGDTAITVFGLDGLHDTAAAAKAIIYRTPIHDVLIHELTHYLDSKRNPVLHDKESSERQGSAAYFNSPVEFNAFYVNLAQPMLQFLHAAQDDRGDGGHAGLAGMARGLGLGRDFKANLAMLVRKAGTKANNAPKRFHDHLDPARRRALLKRLYALHKQVVAELDAAAQAASAGAGSLAVEPAVLEADASRAAAAGKALTVYRGEYGGNKGGNFWTEDREFARQFTQSGLDREVLVRYLAPGDLYRASASVYAGNEAGVDAALAAAEAGGYKAILLSEGPEEPNSIFVFDKSALMRRPPG